VFFEFDQNILQFYGIWDMTKREHGDALRVRLHYHLSDGTIEGIVLCFIIFSHFPFSSIILFYSILFYSMFLCSTFLLFLPSPPVSLSSPPLPLFSFLFYFEFQFIYLRFISINSTLSQSD
jgi:DUF1126 PH-like domain